MTTPHDHTRYDPMRPVRGRVLKRQQENDDTFTLIIRAEETPAHNGADPANLAHDGLGHDGAWLAGQFNMLYVFGIGEIPISLSGDPAEPGTITHTTRAVGTVTRAMSKLQPGDVLGLRGPFGSHWPLDAAADRDVVLVSGGIGLAPLRPVIYQLLDRRADFGKVVLLYGARTQEDMLYRDELAQWRARFDLDIHVTVDRATGGWFGNVGLVTDLVPRAPFDPRRAVAMVCGPEVMMRHTVAALQKRGVADSRIYVSMERNMKCGTGICGHCQYGPHFICRDGPVFRFDDIAPFFGKGEV